MQAIAIEAYGAPEMLKLVTWRSPARSSPAMPTPWRRLA